MSINFSTKSKIKYGILPLFAISALPYANGQQSEDLERIEEIVITGAARTYSALSTTQSMNDQQSPITSILSTIDNLPGVNITEGDTFGFDDWSTTINPRLPNEPERPASWYYYRWLPEW
jgi:hypothetical protein